MDITNAMRAVMRQYDLSEAMVRAIYRGEDGGIMACPVRTETALVKRGIMHRHNSDLTAKGREILAALKTAQGTVAATPAPTEHTPAPMSAEFEANVAAANAVLAGIDFGEHEPPAPAPERLHEDVSYAIAWRKVGGKWHDHVTTSAIHDRDAADTYIADLQALADPGIELRAVEIRLTHTALPAPGEAKPSDVDGGPVDARTLHSGYRVDLHGAERLIWKVDYHHAGNYLQVHTVPPAGENPAYFHLTLSPGQKVELISRGPAVDVTGRPVDSTR